MVYQKAIVLAGLAIVLGLAEVGTIGFTEVAVAQTMKERKAEGDRLVQQANQQFKTREPEAALQSSQQALQIYRAIKDRRGEGQSLANIGHAYRSLNDYAKAIEYSTQSLQVARKIKDQQLEGVVLERLGLIYDTLKDYAKAINYQEQSLAVYRALKDRIGERRVLGNLGNAYLLFGNDAKAIETLEKSLTLSRELKDQAAIMAADSDLGGARFFIENRARELREPGERQYQARQEALTIKDRPAQGNAPTTSEVRLPREAQTTTQTAAVQREQEVGRLLSQGLEQLYLSQFEAADKSIQQALIIYRELKDRSGEQGALQTFGMFYLVYGDFPRAIEYLEQSLPIARELKDREAERITLVSLGNGYAGIGNYAKAINYHEQSLAITPPDQAGYTLGSLGDVYYALGNYARAIEYHQQSLAIALTLKDQQQAERGALEALAKDYQALGNYVKAIKYSQRLLEISSVISTRTDRASAFSGFGQALQKQKQPELAIVFYKQAVNILESIRQESRESEQDARRRGESEGIIERERMAAERSQTEGDRGIPYRNLADLLLQQNRVMEALQVLDLLKVQELQDYLRDIKGKKLTTEGVLLLPQEREIVQAFSQNPAIDQTATSPAVTGLVEQLRQTATAQNLTLATYKDLQARVQKLGKNIALFYPLILDDRLELVVFLPDRPPIHRTVAVPRKQLEGTIQSFSKTLNDPYTWDVKPHAQQLYTWLIQPFAADLQQSNVQTIVYAPDGQMRYVPLAALYDGQQWLTQRFQINYLTALALTPLEPRSTAAPRILAGAYTQGHYKFQVAGKTYEFNGLSFARTEIEQLAAQFPNTTSLFDKAFDRTTILAQKERYNILHFATHAAFVPGKPEDSFIVLGDGSQINLREIADWKLPDTQLVVLSACQTAIGGKLSNGLEVLGFGYQLQRTGVRASIASLWSVNDAGTQTLMNNFYAILKASSLTETEALQKAQIALMTNQKSINLKDKREVVQPLGLNQPQRPDLKSIGYAHPYYWAPFILIGNGL